ncbi:MAG: hypothetical protein AW12_01707 [Candidatus Accumulibacter sp. BA-94]|nr:MAG: hypothetical protein AW12_01707 [Candidatus Accumulibacter sp. BA-94]
MSGAEECEVGVGGRDNDRGGETSSQLLGKTRSGQGATQALAQHLLDDLMRQQPGTSLQALADPQERCFAAAVPQVLQGGPQSGQRGRDQNQIGIACGRRDVGRGAQRWRETMTGQVARVLALGLQTTNLIAITRPQDDRVSVSESNRQGGTPGSGT